MNIRALTGFLDPGWPLEARRIGALAACLKACREALGSAGYNVQTLRFATPPPAEMTKPVRALDRPELARQLEAEGFVHGLDYACLGPALPDDADGLAAIPDVLAAAENVFTSALYADLESGVTLAAARACAQAILTASTLHPDGFANLRFASLANVPSGSPYFPSAYHRGGTPAMAVATEGAELAVDALREVASPAVARRRLVSMIEAHAAALTRVVQPIAAQHEVRFLGLDFSLAPFPEHGRSLGTAIESFGTDAVGSPGSLAAAAFLADALDQATFRRTGFCGLFFPVLEDEILAARAAAGALSITDLLLLSTVCGSGLDTIPIPGDSSSETLTALLIDLGALALRLNKPLTARLMPIPGKSAGDEVRFDFPYFAASRVLPLPASPLGGLLTGGGILDLRPRPLA
ncbi:MAG TPA: DUF711 family protein [Anaerolineales bacterium]|nr:DUF711 family protein [Anaerolineales bacterium]